MKSSRLITRKIIVIAGIILLSVLLFACSSNSDDKKNEAPTKFNIGYLRVPNDEYIAISKKYIDEYFANKGIEVNYIIVDSGVEANKAFASGSLDFASMGNTNGIVALATGLDTELVWIHEALGDIEALVVRDGLGIEKIEDLKGKKIATIFSSTSHYSLLNALKEAGIENDVTLLDMLTVDIVAAWNRGDIDAAYTWEPTLSELKSQNAKVLLTSADMAKKGYVTANVGLVRKSFAQKNPDIIAGFLKQLDKANTFYLENKLEAIKVAAEGLELPYDVVEKQMAGSIWLGIDTLNTDEYMGSSDKPGKFSQIMKDTADFLKEQDSIRKSPSKEEFDKFINVKYIERAKEITE